MGRFTQSSRNSCEFPARGPVRALAVFALALLAATAPEAATAGVEVYEAPSLPAGVALLETPGLAADVAAGRLPPVAERLPALPCANPAGPTAVPGKPGGQLRTLIAKSKDTRLLAVYGYARLVGFDATLNLVPDIVHRIEVEDGRRFTLKLRPGHRWSDGHPFTAEDFRYYWEDVANNDKLSPSGPPRALLVEGAPPAVSYPDDVTVVYSWEEPNPFFLPALAGARPLFI